MPEEPRETAAVPTSFILRAKGGHGLRPTRRNTGRAGSGRGPARPVDENPGPWAKPVGRIFFEQKFYRCFYSIKGIRGRRGGTGGGERGASDGVPGRGGCCGGCCFFLCRRAGRGGAETPRAAIGSPPSFSRTPRMEGVSQNLLA